jgi:hypothetical protein
MSSISRERSPGGAPTALTAFLKEDSDNWGRIVAKAGFQIEWPVAFRFTDVDRSGGTLLCYFRQKTARRFEEARLGSPWAPVVFTENLSSGVFVVMSADGVWFDASDSLNRTTNRRNLVQGLMRSEMITIVGVTFQNSAQMRLTEENDVGPNTHAGPIRSAVPQSRSAKARLVR